MSTMKKDVLLLSAKLKTRFCCQFWRFWRCLIDVLDGVADVASRAFSLLEPNSAYFIPKTDTA